MSFDLDVAIVGAGPVAVALACLLARATPVPARVALFGAPSAARVQGERDPRTLAMNYGTRQALDALQAWPATAAAISDIHVSQRGRLGRTHICRQDFDVPALGYTVAYADLIDVLDTRARALGIARQPALAAGGASNTQDGVCLRTNAGDVLARVAVVADGAPAAEIARDYDQHALLATVQVSQPRIGWAYERFCREGPLALLPHPRDTDSYSVVWCCRPATAARLRDMAPAAFLAALQDEFGDRLGSFTATGPRHVFPLSLKARRTLVDGRIVAIGNAAQTLHPVAGQGLNLGLRDAIQLAGALAPGLVRTPDAPAGDLPARLARYAATRQADRWTIGAITDMLPRVFATGLPLVDHACGAALLALDTSAVLRAPLARQLLYGTRR